MNEYLIDGEKPENEDDIYTVGEISTLIRRVVEDEFPFIRIRGEVSGFTRAGSGHLYFSLKDEKDVIDAVCWKGSAARLATKPEDGLEVIITGRITTYGPRSRYQVVVEQVEAAGEGALLKLLEERKRKLAAEGIFDSGRKKEIPFMPNVIGVVTSPTGAVIRDILHRIAERFPVRVIVWPVQVQGEGAARQVADAIRGFDALGPQSSVPRPDVLIIARGGGSVEDLWAFNEEEPVRAAAECTIPVISAIGHETDTTLMDYAADLRAPTPTAAAEMAVPVKAELQGRLGEEAGRLVRMGSRVASLRREKFTALARAIPDLERVLGHAAQRLDDWRQRLDGALKSGVDNRFRLLAQRSAGLASPGPRIALGRNRMHYALAGLARVAGQATGGRRARVAVSARMLESLSYHRVLERGFALVENSSGVIVSSVKNVSPGEDVSLRLADGSLGARITSGASGKNKKPPAATGGDRQGKLL